MAHARVHVRLAALDVVVEVVPEQRDVADRLGRDGRRGEVAGEEHKRDVANIVAVAQSGQPADLERRLAVREQDLGRVLDLGQATRVDEFLVFVVVLVLV